MNQKLLVRVLLGVLALLLVAGMVVQFTPALSSLRGSSKGTPALKVNGETVTVQELEKVRQQNPVLGLAQGGVLGEDFKTALVYSQVQNAVVTQAVKDIDVPRADVAKQVQALRDSRGLKSNKDYTAFLQGVGLTDAQVRDLFRNQLANQKKVEQIREAAPKPTDAEARLYYDLNPDAFRTEQRVVGREIVVADQKKANDLLAQLKGGADFAALASANSLENKDRGGALGQVQGGKVQPVGAAALPAEVAAAAFKLTKGGVTDVVKSGGRFYIVQVAQYLAPTTQPFASAQSAALNSVKTRKQDAAVEAWFDGLVKNAKVEVLDPDWAWYNPAVATVAGQKVPYAELLGAMLSNQQIVSLLQSQPPEQAATFVNTFFKPQVLDPLIQQYAAPVIAKNLGLPVTGSRQEMQQALLAYGGRDVKVTDADVAAAYQAHKTEFETPASATVSEASFGDKAKAEAFRTAFAKSGGDFTAAASKAGGTVAERGSVKAGETDPNTQQPKLDPAIDKALFGAAKLQPAGEGSLSAVVPLRGRFVVAYAGDLVRASTKPLSEVQDDLRTQLLASEREKAGETFLKTQLGNIKVENNLQKVLQTLQKRAAASAPKSTAGQEQAQGGNAGGQTGTGQTGQNGTTPKSSTGK